jgi:tetratricopeptide (TPR) repeat protein
LLRTSEEEKAEALYRNILASLPSHFEAKFNLTNKLYNEGRIEEALKFAQELYEEQERNTQVLTLYGRVLMQNSSPEKALEILQLASTIAPREVSVKEALIDLYISQSDYRDALSEINSLLKDDFLNARYINKRSRIYLALEQNTKAKEDFQTLFGLYNNDVSNLYQLSLLQSQIDDPRGLIKTLERIIEIDADNFYAKRDRIRALLDTRQLELAKDSLALLIKEYPKNPDLMLLEGNYQLYTGNKKKAAEYYIDAIKLQNTLTPALISAVSTGRRW